MLVLLLIYVPLRKIELPPLDYSISETEWNKTHFLMTVSARLVRIHSCYYKGSEKKTIKIDARTNKLHILKCKVFA